MRYERTKEKLILFSFVGFLSLYKRLRACVVEVWICWCSPLVTVGCCWQPRALGNAHVRKDVQETWEARGQWLPCPGRDVTRVSLTCATAHLWETRSPVQTQKMDSETPEVQRKWDFNGGLARSGAWLAGTPKAVTTSILFSNVEVPPLVLHWLSTVGVPSSQTSLKFYYFNWVILKYVSLGIGQILESRLLVAFTSLCFFVAGGPSCGRCILGHKFPHFIMAPP
jgi:hypothetical protein